MPRIIATGALLAALAIPSTAAAACTEQHHCGRTFTLKAHTIRYETPERFAREAPIQSRVYVNGHELPSTASGLVVGWYGRGVAARVVAQRGTGPLVFRFASAFAKPLRIHVSYWIGR